MTKISIIIPCYQQTEFARILIAKLKKEVFPPWEILVIEDGASQSSFLKDDFSPSVRFFLNPIRSGVSRARNLGLSHSTGDYIYFIDADDISVPGTLNHMRKFLNETPQESAIGGQLAGFIDSLGRPLKPTNEETVLGQFTGARLSLSYYQEGGVTPPFLARFLFRKSICEKTGKFSEELHFAEDWDWMLRLLKQTSIKILPIPSFYYRIHSQNSTIRFSSGEISSSARARATGHLVRLSHGVRKHLAEGA